MWLFYLLAFIPVIIGAVLYIKYSSITIQEWLIVSSIAFICSGIFHGILYSGMTSDTETWSGEITSATFHPTWIEEYQERHSETYYTGSGDNRVAHERVWYTTEHRTHHEYWDANTSLNYTRNITENEFTLIRSQFKNFTTEKPYKGGFDGGDPNIYVSYNRTGFVFPVTDKRSFVNKVKACPSLFSFAKVPKDITVFDYPQNNDWRVSDRLIGTATRYFNQFKFDQLNADLGPKKFVNLIIIGIPDNAESILGEYQEAKFIGGRKNDLVICFGGCTPTNGKGYTPSWCKVFGWTESEIVKKNLESLLLTNKINNDLLPKIREEILRNFEPKDWSKFDYLSVEPPTWTYWLYLFILLVVQGGAYYYCFINEFEKNSHRMGYNYYR